MARRFTGFLWIIFFAVVGVTFYLGFLLGFNQGREEAASKEKAAKEQTVTVEKAKEEDAVLRIRAGEDYFSYEMRAGELLATVVRVANEGSVSLYELSIELEAPEPMWSMTASPFSIPVLEPETGEEIDLEIKPSAEITPGEYRLVVKVTGKTDSGAPVEAQRPLIVNIVQ
jgi:uncharacterized membrane protein